jgi:uncharacterized protein (TIGR00369 family)
MMESLGGVELIELDEANGSCVLEFECLERFCHSGGKVAQGGFVTAWMDAAMAHAVSLTQGNQQQVMSLDISVRFLQPVGPGMVRAHGRTVRRGKRIAFMEAELFNDQQELVATATSSGVLR